MGFFDRIKSGLTKTRKAMASSLGSVFSFSEINDDFYDELEECLILGDLGVNTAVKAVDALRARVKAERLKSAEDVKAALREILTGMLEVGDLNLNLETQPSIILMIGVNGVGKTTTIGKLADQLQQQGKKVLLCAADTFRAAAAEQLEIWAKRAQVELDPPGRGGGPGLRRLRRHLRRQGARHCDVILCDTAGRLHNKQNLMNELQQDRQASSPESCPTPDRETLLVLDGTTGQNGLLQAKQFSEVADVTGIVLTKLDGTAKGGIVIAVADTLQIPVKLIGVGEQIDDLMPFQPADFVQALL